MVTGSCISSIELDAITFKTKKEKEPDTMSSIDTGYSQIDVCDGHTVKENKQHMS